MLYRTLFLAGLVVFGMISLVTLASAQEVSDTVINVRDLLAPWLEMLVGAVAILITAILGWVASMIKRKTGVDIDLARMQTLQQTLNNAAGILIAKLGAAAEGVTFDARHPAIKDAILYVSQNAPEAVKHFGLSPEQIAEKLTAKIGLATTPVKAEVVKK